MLLLFLTAILSTLAWGQQQPFEFPHSLHAAQGLECVDCHSTADTSAEASIPSVTKCMLCHEKVAVDGPGVAVLREFFQKRHEIPWKRIYGFNELALVKFRHAPHVISGIECAECHGDVAKMSVATRAVKHTMGTCVACHRKNGASDDCAVCHY